MAVTGCDDVFYHRGGLGLKNAEMKLRMNEWMDLIAEANARATLIRGGISCPFLSISDDRPQN